MAATRRGGLTLGLASLGFISLGLPEGLLGVAWPSIRASFGLPLDALGVLLATFATGYFVSSAASGRLLQRLGVGTVLAASCSLTGACLVGYALSPAWATMVTCGGILGLGAGTIDAGLNTYAAVLHGSRVLNWMHAAFGLGAAVGPLLMTAILSSGLAWSVGYMLVGLAQLGLGAAYAALRANLDVRPAAEHERSALTSLLRIPVAWLLIALFFVYVGVEVVAGQWSYSLFTQARGIAPALAGVLVSMYWGSLTIGRLVFGIVAPHVPSAALLRGCMATIVVAAAVLAMNLGLASAVALAVIGLAAAPIFPILIAETPARLGGAHAPNAIGLQVAAAVVGGAALPGSVGAVAARLGLEVVGPCLLIGALCLLVLHEILVRRVFERPQSARCRSTVAASSRPGA